MACSVSSLTSIKRKALSMATSSAENTEECPGRENERVSSAYKCAAHALLCLGAVSKGESRAMASRLVLDGSRPQLFWEEVGLSHVRQGDVNLWVDALPRRECHDISASHAVKTGCRGVASQNKLRGLNRQWRRKRGGGGAGGAGCPPQKDVGGQTCLFATPSEASGRVKKNLTIS